VLRKDFLRSREQIDESCDAGAAAVLLIVATTPRAVIPSLLERTRRLGMEAVIEVHTRAELDYALTLSPRILGINNRDILALEKDSGDVRVTEELAPLVPEGILTISESSLRSRDDIQRAIAAGAHAVLVGTAILQFTDLASGLGGLAGSPNPADAPSGEARQ
jgi:indole-3-glycerol phosphate synthase